MTHNAASGVARVHYELRSIDDRGIVVARMIGGDDNGVIASQSLRVQRDGLHIFVVIVPHFMKLREVGIVVFEGCAALLEELHDFERWRFAKVIDVFLVGDPENEKLRSLETLLVLVES